MRLPIVEIRRSEGEAALARHKLTGLETAILKEMEGALAPLARQAPLEKCHRVVTAVGARHGLRKAPSIALWTRGALRMFEPGASEHPTAEVGYRLERLVDFAFSHAAPQILAAGSMAPFLVTLGSGPPALKTFEQVPTKLAGAEARRAAGRLGFDVQAYALALVGPPNPLSTSRTVYVEAAERASLTGHLFARDYKPTGSMGRLEFTGPHERVGEAANILIGGEMG